jgi:hypothetical protein
MLDKLTPWIAIVLLCAYAIWSNNSLMSDCLHSGTTKDTCERIIRP